MIRVMTADEPASTAITVDGSHPIEICCIQAISIRKPVRLYLRDVTLIDERGRALLRKLVEKSVGLKATGIYSSNIVDEMHPPD